LAAQRGLAGQEGDTWILDPDDFVLETGSAIPITDPEIGAEPYGGTFERGIAIAPMGVLKGALMTKHAIQISFVPDDDPDGEQRPGFEKLFTVAAVQKSAPAGLWGQPRFNNSGLLMLPNPNDPALIRNTLSGFEIRPGTGTQPTASISIPRGELLPGEWGEVNVIDAFQWQTPAGPVCAEDGDPAARREQLLSALGIEGWREVR
jgi:hypothetical protein